MNEELPPEKPKRKRAKAVRAPRVLDPEVVAIRKAASEQVRQLHRSRASERVLRVILDKRLAQLTDAHKQALYDALAKIVTPALLKENQA